VDVILNRSAVAGVVGECLALISRRYTPLSEPVKEHIRSPLDAAEEDFAAILVWDAVEGFGP
jgi:hypothetical protein